MDHIAKPKTLREHIAESKSLVNYNGQYKTLKDLWYPGQGIDSNQPKTLIDHNVTPKTLRDHIIESQTLKDFWCPGNRDGPDQPSRISFLANNIVNRPQSINMFSEFNKIEDAYSYTRESKEDRFAALTRMIETLESKGPTQYNQVPASMCTGCNALDHVMEECPFWMNPTQNRFTQGSAAYENYMNEPYAPTYNLGWENHSNSAWSQDATLGAYSFNQPYLRPNQILNDQSGLDYEKSSNTLERSIEALEQSTLDMTSTFNSFMQATGQLLNSNTQVIARLDTQLNQLAKIVNKQEEGESSSQLEVDFRVHDGPEPQQEDQFDELNISKSGEQVFRDIEIPENQDDNGNEVSILSDHRTQPSLELIVEPLMTLVEPLPIQVEAIKETPEPLPQYLENTCLGPRPITESNLGPILENKLLANKEIKSPRSEQPIDFNIYDELDQPIDVNSTHGNNKPSIGGAPESELKPLPVTFRYVFLGSNDTIPVIITSNLTCDQEAQLMGALQEYKEAIERTIADLKGIDPSLYIYCEPNDKNLQRGLNPTMWEVDINGITTWSDEDIIYPTLNSQEVSPIQGELFEPGIITIKGISHIMVKCRKYYTENPESRRELQTHVKFRAGIG